MGKAANNIAARVEKMVADVSAPAATSESAPDASAGLPLAGSEASGAESGAAAAGQPASLAATGEPAPVVDPAAVQKTQHELLKEKLDATRERRAAQRASQRDDAERQRLNAKAKADADAAAAEKAKWDAIGKGTFREAIAARGEDPRAVFEAMAEEARNAGKPETMIAKARADLEKQLAEVVEPLKKELEEEKRARAAEREQANEARFVGDFNRTVAQDKYEPLLVEYEPQTLYEIARTLRDDPPRLIAMAQALKVPLTAPQGRFNMTDICNVLAAKHAEHEAGREQRRARLQASKTSPGAPTQAPANAPTVNGTADKRNAAGNPLGNNAASSRSTEKTPARPTRRERIQREIDRVG